MQDLDTFVRHSGTRESNWTSLTCSPCPFSLRQMENNAIDLKKVEAETTEKIAGVIAQKVNIVAAFIEQMKVRVATLTSEGPECEE